jgi:23S rRNA (cytosine1962-C5)-methyltransferase
MDNTPPISVLNSIHWRDYELLDSGDGFKFERFGPRTLVRPEVQAMWRKNLSDKEWALADGIFKSTNEESGGHWAFRQEISQRWEMTYRSLRFWAMTTPGRHLGVFPEVAAHWDFMEDAIRNAGRSVRILNLFGYTGLASLTAAAAGAEVTHIDASKKSVTWARENQVLSKLEDKPIRWIVDDAVKFVQREGRRGAQYDGIILDPPKFGRGPKGEIWEVYASLPRLLEGCRAILSKNPLFLIATVYAVKASAIHLGQAIQDIMGQNIGHVISGELATQERAAGRWLSQAVFARWQTK